MCTSVTCMPYLMNRACYGFERPSCNKACIFPNSTDFKDGLFELPRPGAVARSEACSLGMQVAPSLIPTSGTFFAGNLVMKTFLRPFSLFRWFKKSGCQLLAKECALSTGKLPRRLAQEQWLGNWPRPKWPQMCWRAVKQKSNELPRCFCSLHELVGKYISFSLVVVWQQSVMFKFVKIAFFTPTPPFSSPEPKAHWWAYSLNIFIQIIFTYTQLNIIHVQIFRIRTEA